MRSAANLRRRQRIQVRLESMYVGLSVAACCQFACNKRVQQTTPRLLRQAVSSQFWLPPPAKVFTQTEGVFRATRQERTSPSWNSADLRLCFAAVARQVRFPPPARAIRAPSCPSLLAAVFPRPPLLLNRRSVSRAFQEERRPINVLCSRICN